MRDPLLSALYEIGDTALVYKRAPSIVSNLPPQLAYSDFTLCHLVFEFESKPFAYRDIRYSRPRP